MTHVNVFLFSLNYLEKSIMKIPTKHELKLTRGGGGGGGGFGGGGGGGWGGWVASW